MENRGFQYSFTMRELWFYLFSKKICPKCGNKLVKKKEYEIRTDLFHSDGADSIFKPDSKVKKYLFRYTCEKCGLSSELKDIVKRDNK